MEDFQITYVQQQINKISEKNSFQKAISTMIMHDNYMSDFMPIVEYCNDSNKDNFRVDIYYPKIKTVIEIDELHHENHVEEDQKREEIIIQNWGVQKDDIHRIKQSQKNWHEQFQIIKEKIKKKYDLQKGWHESDLCNFKKIQLTTSYKDCGEQIRGITYCIFNNYFDFIKPARKLDSTNDNNYKGVFINPEGKNNNSNPYIAIVAYEKYFKKNNELTFAVFDKRIKNQNIKLTSSHWKHHKSINKKVDVPRADCRYTTLEIDSNFLNQKKEEQFQKIKNFIVDNFNFINSQTKIIDLDGNGTFTL